MDKEKIITYLLAGLAIIIVFNQFQIISLDKNSNNIASASLNTVNAGTGLTTGGLTTGIQSVSALDILPKGIPDIYGKELGISYDDVNVRDPAKADSTINKLALFDEKITLEGEKLQRYILITNSISCEYCCGAASITFPDGQPACGCAHSYAMRGLAKYLLIEHPEMSDGLILEELGKWKTLFFPDVMNAKASVLKDQDIELNYINIASNKYRGAEKGSSAQGSMVGGC